MHGFVDHFFVAIDREVVAVAGDVGLWHEEALFGALAVGFGGAVAPAAQDVGNIVFVRLGRAFVVQGKAVGLHVVKPDLIRAAGIGFGEEQNGGTDPGVGFEHAGGHGDHAVQFLLFHQDFTQGFVRRAGAEQHAVGHDHGRPSAGLQQAQKEGHKEQFGLFGFDHPQQIFGRRFIIQAAGKGGIGEDQRVVFGLAAGLLRQGIAVADVGIFHACSSMFMLPMRSMVLSKS